MPEFFKNERQAWRKLRGPQNRNVRRRLWYQFKKTFPEGHNASLRPYVEYCATQEGRQSLHKWRRNHHLHTLHLGALEVLAKHGKDYIPITWYIPPKFGEPKPESCFENAWLLTETSHSYRTRFEEENRGETIPERKRVMYVEGIVAGPLSRPMHHAWNTLGLQGIKAFDWTFYAGAQWNRYIGIPFTRDEYRQATELVYPTKPELCSLFSRKAFPQVESFMCDLLSRRKH